MAWSKDTAPLGSGMASGHLSPQTEPLVAPGNPSFTLGLQGDLRPGGVVHWVPLNGPLWTQGFGGSCTALEIPWVKSSSFR